MSVSKYAGGHKTQKECAMKRRFLAIWAAGAVLAVLPLLAGGCASLVDVFSGETADIDASTTIWGENGVWAAKIDQFARGDADAKASRQRQVTQKQTVWKPVGYDYEFNSGELKVGIAEGKYKLGEAEYRPSNSSVGFDDYAMGPLGNYVYPVYLKTTENVATTVTEVDKELWQQTYAESRKMRQSHIESKVWGTNVSPAAENASPVRQKVMARLEKRLREDLLPGTKLVYGGWTGGKYEQENVLYAYLDDDGSFVCKWCK
jgi:hypothetical protein